MRDLNHASLQHTLEQGHQLLIRKKLIQQDKPIIDANLRPLIVINIYPKNNKLHD